MSRGSHQGSRHWLQEVVHDGVPDGNLVVIANDANASAVRPAFEALFRWTAGLCATASAQRTGSRHRATHGRARCDA